MRPIERRNQILDQLSKDGKIDLDQLAEQFNVSVMTIRRDLNLLESEDEVIRTYGGAVLKKPLVIERSFQEKETQFSDQKRLIAKMAIDMIPEHATILLDSGTTTFEIAKLLKTKQGITVITNDIKIAVELMDSDLKVFITGGELQNNIGALFGPLTEQILKNVHVDLFFLGAHAVDLHAGISAPAFEKAFIKKIMVDAAETTWLVTDSSKFGHKSLAKVCNLTEIEGVITDEGITEECEGKLKEHMNLVIAGRTAN